MQTLTVLISSYLIASFAISLPCADQDGFEVSGPTVVIWLQELQEKRDGHDDDDDFVR
jgi:hypothetical protein